MVKGSSDHVVLMHKTISLEIAYEETSSSLWLLKWKKFFYKYAAERLW